MTRPRLRHLAVRIALAFAGGNAGGAHEVRVLHNGKPVFTRRVGGPGAGADYTLPELLPGGTVAVRAQATPARPLEPGVGIRLPLAASRC
jgi:hypothetical protein